MAASVCGLCIRLTILELAAGERTQPHQQQDNNNVVLLMVHGPFQYHNNQQQGIVGMTVLPDCAGDRRQQRQN
jgi:hypothetical protein